MKWSATLAMMHRPPRALNLVLDPAPEELRPVDWSSWYLTDEADMGEGFEQNAIITALVSAINALASERGWPPAHIAGDQFFAWVEEEPLVRISPDIYILDGVWTPPGPPSFQTWLPGHAPPRFAMEIVSENWRKDYRDGPPKYAQLGVGELVIFDGTPQRRRERVAFQVFRRSADGSFLRVYAGDGPAWSAELEAWIHVEVVGKGARRPFLAADEAGQQRLRTDAERSAEAGERAEAERARAEAERAARLELEAEVACLKARLEAKE